LPTRDLLASVVADRPARAAGLGRLAVQRRGLRGPLPPGLPPHPRAEGVVDPLPNAGPAPLAEVVVAGAPGRVGLGQLPPLAAGAVDVQDAVADVVQVHAPGPAAGLGPGQQGRQAGELGVGQVAGVVRGAHGPFYGSLPPFRTGT